MAKGGDVKVPAKDISEPNFRYGPGGDWETVHPGNKEFVRGDKIPRPEGGGNGSGGRQSGSGESVDDFGFTLSRDEFLSIFFEDLELPNLMRTAIAEAQDKKLIRAGYVKEGTPSTGVIHHEDRLGAAHRWAGRQGRAGSSTRTGVGRVLAGHGHTLPTSKGASWIWRGAWRVCRFSTTSTCVTVTGWRCRNRPPERSCSVSWMCQRPWMSARKTWPSASSPCCICF
jgi:hypothetical protein